MQATLKDLNFYFEDILNTAIRGEEVIILHKGKPYAKLIPIEEEKERKARPNDLFGIWQDNSQTEDVRKYIRKIRRGRSDAY